MKKCPVCLKYDDSEKRRFCKHCGTELFFEERFDAEVRVSKFRHLASLITVSRIVGAFLLLLTKPLTSFFYFLYALCCISDIADGYIARKTKTESRTGEILDSIADFILIVVVLVIFIPLLAWEHWMFYWMGAIALTRVASYTVGYMKYHAFPFLHTYANKATGIALACFPFLYYALGMTVTATILCGIASLSALEELRIAICSKELDRNKVSLFSKKQ